MNPLPNKADISPFYLSFLDLLGSAVSIPTNQTNKPLHLITSLKPTLKAHKINLCKTNNLRDPSLRAGGLDPITLKIGYDVALSFDLPNYQNMGHQHPVQSPSLTALSSEVACKKGSFCALEGEILS